MDWWQWCLTGAWASIALGLASLWIAVPDNDRCRLSLASTGPHPRTSWTLCVHLIGMNIAWCSARAIAFSVASRGSTRSLGHATDVGAALPRPVAMYPRGKARATLNLCDWLYFFSVSCCLSAREQPVDFLVFFVFWVWAFVVAAGADAAEEHMGPGFQISSTRTVVLLLTIFMSYTTSIHTTSHELWTTNSIALRTTGAAGVTVLLLYALAPLVEDADQDAPRQSRSTDKNPPMHGILFDVARDILSCSCIATARNRLAIAMFLTREIMCVALVTVNTVIGIAHAGSQTLQ